MRTAKQTLLQFPAEVPGAAREPSTKSGPRATVCSTCQQRFSPDSHFCPFDGQTLAFARDWDASGDPLIGTVIDARYHVERVVGAGGMGIVYAVRHSALGKRFALKALRADLWSDPQVAERFVQEARSAASVQHPGLVEITDFGRLPSGQAYFVMEYLDGQPLSQLLRQAGQLTARRTVDIARQAAEALHAAHQRGIVHRDLKPGNIHVDPGAGFGERVKIVDFGLAQVAGKSRVTRAGIVYGTPHYMSPEQAAGGIVDLRSDIYSLGVVMYEMITGRLPFEADTYLGVLSQHMHALPEHPSKFCPDFAGFPALGNVVLRCLEKNPADRYESLTTLIKDLAVGEQAAEASAVRMRFALAPSSGPSLITDELAPNSLTGLTNIAPLEIPAGSNPLWVKLAVVGLAFVASVLFAFAFRPKSDIAQAGVLTTAPGRPPLLVASVTTSVHDEPAPPMRGSSAGPTSQSSAVATVSRPTPGLHAGHHVTGGSGRKQSTSVRALGASEILDPWGK